MPQDDDPSERLRFIGIGELERHVVPGSACEMATALPGTRVDRCKHLNENPHLAAGRAAEAAESMLDVSHRLEERSAELRVDVDGFLQRIRRG